MRNLSRLILVAAAMWLVATAGKVAKAQVLTPASLLPCAFGLGEVTGAMGVEVDRMDAADMTIPVGRDVGCLYSIKGTDFVFGVRQTWDSTRAVASPTPVGSSNATGGQVVYVVGKVQITVFWHGGNLSSADGLRRLLLLRQLP
jgi:hypothetical protein